MILPGTWSPDTKGSPVRHYTEIRGKAVCGERVVVGVEADAKLNKGDVLDAVRKGLYPSFAPEDEQGDTEDQDDGGDAS